MTRLFVMTFCSIVLIGCGSPSTDSGIAQGKDTRVFSGTYKGILELQATVDSIGNSLKMVNDSARVDVVITENGRVGLTIDEIRLEGIVDNDGNWELAISINDFGSLINEESKEALKMAGCVLGEEFGKFEGLVTPPTMSGELNHKLSCRVLFVTAGVFEISGTLTATM